jgi:hypothetical protein
MLSFDCRLKKLRLLLRSRIPNCFPIVLQWLAESKTTLPSPAACSDDENDAGVRC